MTREELARHDGREGRRALVAVNGKVYDVTESPRWENGLHPPDHLAGNDLTEELPQAPHIRAVVERFPVVGTLDPPPVESSPRGRGTILVGVVIAAMALAIIIAIML